jgi:hypothetical protein
VVQFAAAGGLAESPRTLAGAHAPHRLGCVGCREIDGASVGLESKKPNCNLEKLPSVKTAISGRGTKQKRIENLQRHWSDIHH